MPSNEAGSNAGVLAMQMQLQVLQMENAMLTKQICLKENFVQQKEQQLRVMQQRLDELEGVVAMWRDKYFIQVQAVDGGGKSVAATGASTPENGEVENAKWKHYDVLQASGIGGQDAEQVAASMEKLASPDREKLLQILALKSSKPNLLSLVVGSGVKTTAEQEHDAECEQTFVDVTEETQRVLLFYLLPVLQQSKKNGVAIDCFMRTYARPTMDFRVVCHAAAKTKNNDTGTSVRVTEPALPSPDRHVRTGVNDGSSKILSISKPLTPLILEQNSPQAAPPPRGLSMMERQSSSSSITSTGSRHGTSAASAQKAEEHLFDCVDCDNISRAVQHGPRGLHPTKPVYVSKPLINSSRSSTATTASSSAASTPRSTEVSSPFSASFRGSEENSFSSSRSTYSDPKDPRKMKKLMGSMFKGLKGHRSPRATMVYRNENLDDDENATCDGCGRGPITGNKWICRTCRMLHDQEYQLCDKCYGQGMHGKENEDALFERIEEIVVAKCPKLLPERELMRLMRVGICKANLKKYSFCLTWISDLVQAKAVKDLRARALEISQITPQVRSEFVRLLRELLAKHRRDIEIVTEWQPATNAATTTPDDDNGVGVGSPSLLQLDTLRIWVKDGTNSEA